MKEKDYSEAKKIYYEYEGSSFHMFHDRFIDFKEFKVPKHIEEEWLADLTEKKLEQLDSEGNWKVVHFLSSHGLVDYLDYVLDVDPKGPFWQKCAFLEELLDFGQRKRVSKENRNRIKEYVIYWLNTLPHNSPNFSDKERIQHILSELKNYD